MAVGAAALTEVVLTTPLPRKAPVDVPGTASTGTLCA